MYQTQICKYQQTWRYTDDEIVILSKLYSAVVNATSPHTADEPPTTVTFLDQEISMHRNCRVWLIRNSS